MNAITIHPVAKIVHFGRLAVYLVGGDIASLFGRYADLVQPLVAILLEPVLNFL